MHVAYTFRDVITEIVEKFSTLHNQIVMHTQPNESTWKQFANKKKKTCRHAIISQAAETTIIVRLLSS